jgi:hypothetical protein
MSIPSLLAAPPSQHASKVDPETSTGPTRRNRALLVNEALRDRTLREQIVVLDYELRGGPPRSFATSSPSISTATRSLPRT